MKTDDKQYRCRNCNHLVWSKIEIKNCEQCGSENCYKITHMKGLPISKVDSLIDEIKLSRGCQNINCQWDGKFESCMLDFHHLHDKEFNISQWRHKGRTIETLANEIKKCVVLCSNCHRTISRNLDFVEFKISANNLNLN